jgi:hypothetical protein
MPSSSPSAGVVGGAYVNAKQKNSLSVVEAENGFIVNGHFNGIGSGGQHIAADLDVAHEIIKGYFAKE